MNQIKIIKNQNNKCLEDLNFIDNLLNDKNVDELCTQIINELNSGSTNCNTEQLSKKTTKINENENNNNEPSRKFFKSLNNRIPMDNGNNVFPISISDHKKSKNQDFYISDDDITDLISQVNETPLLSSDIYHQSNNQTKSSSKILRPPSSSSRTSTTSTSALTKSTTESFKQNYEFIKTISSLPNNDNNNNNNNKQKSNHKKHNNDRRPNIQRIIQRIINNEKDVKEKLKKFNDETENNNYLIKIDDYRNRIIEMNRKMFANNEIRMNTDDNDDDDNGNEEYKFLLSTIGITF